MTHLRQIMLEERERRNYAQTTIDCYIHAVEHFSRYFRRSPEQLVRNTSGSYLRVKRNTPPQIRRASDNARSSAQKVNFILRPSCCHSQYLINCQEEHLVADGQRRKGRADCNNNGSHPCYGLRGHGTHRKSLKNDSTSSLPVMQELSIPYRSPISDLTAIGDWSHRSTVRRCGISPE